MSRKSTGSTMPNQRDLLIPMLRAIKELGGSGTIEEIDERVTASLHLPDQLLDLPHPGRPSRSEIEYRLAWNRTRLKRCGLISNSGRGVWSLSSSVDIDSLDPDEIWKSTGWHKQGQARELASTLDLDIENATETDTPEPPWEQKLHKIVSELNPSAFERLVQLLLRESGFIQVEVTGKSGDGGIDGIGIVRIANFLRFQVLFQCKRYKTAITPGQVRDFRGAMQGRTDKGIFITTGTFTRAAIREANRDGAPTIDLIDGELLIQRLKELGLGVRIKMVESVEINSDWFAEI